MKRSPLTRRTPLKRTGRLKPVGERGRRKQAEMRDAREVVLARSGGRCEACERHSLPECNGVATDAHHVQRASQGGVNHPSNLLALSRAHHDWVHAHPAAAKGLGLLR